MRSADATSQAARTAAPGWLVIVFASIASGSWPFAAISARPGVQPRPELAAVDLGGGTGQRGSPARQRNGACCCLHRRSPAPAACWAALFAPGILTPRTDQP